jgi:alkylation response protein AidB-like acyl-CoA dehydrogenase
MDYLSFALVYEELGRVDSSVRGFLAVHAGLVSLCIRDWGTEAAVKAASDAVLIHGGRGYSNAFPVERYYRDIKGLQIYEGTSHIQRIVIARELVGKE